MAVTPSERVERRMRHDWARDRPGVPPAPLAVYLPEARDACEACEACADGMPMAWLIAAAEDEEDEEKEGLGFCNSVCAK